MSRTLNSVVQSHQAIAFIKNEKPLFLNTQIHSSNTQQLEKCKELIESLSDQQIKTKEQLEDLSVKLQQQNYKKGLGFYSAKNLLFIQYLITLKTYELFKINGEDFTKGCGLDLYQRLAYLKVLLTKLSPVQKKLEYQTNKILKNADKALVIAQQRKIDNNQEQDQEQKQEQKSQIQQEEEQQEEDQMAFKPQATALMNIKKQKDISIKKDGKYQAPKISSNLSKEQKIKEKFQKQKQRKKIGLIRRLQNDLIDREDAHQVGLDNDLSEKLKKKFRQKIQIQEQNFTRFPQTKKQKFYRKNLIRNNVKGNQLLDQLKQVKLVGQLFNQQNQAIQKFNKTKITKKDHKQTSMGKMGKKKRKIQ